MQVASIVPDTEAEGPGRRFALWVQGCPIRCPGCCNPEMFSDRGEYRTVDDIYSLILEAKKAGVEGVTFLGGEPFAQAKELAQLAKLVKAAGLTVMVFSGYTVAEIHGMGDDAKALFEQADLLVDGRYDQTKPEPPPPVGRRWIGSSNQIMHFLTSAYSVDDPRMRESNTIEIRLNRNTMSANGWPSLQKMIKRKKQQ